MRNTRFDFCVLAVALAFSTPACARGFKLAVAAQPIAVAKSDLTVTPSQDWNQLGARPGRNPESWTMDGLSLNDVTFYGGVPNDDTLFKDRNKKDRPLPHFSSTMLAPDVAQLFEQTYRLVNDTPIFKIDGMEPAKFMDKPGFRFTYSFTSQDDEVRRKGEANGAIIGGKLYMITYEAPVIYYYDISLAPYRKLVGSAALK